MTQHLRYLSTQDLKNQIENLRYDMVTLGLTLGVSHAKTLEISKKLDMYLTEYQSRSGTKPNLQNTSNHYYEIS